MYIQFDSSRKRGTFVISGWPSCLERSYQACLLNFVIFLTMNSGTFSVLFNAQYQQVIKWCKQGCNEGGQGGTIPLARNYYGGTKSLQELKRPNNLTSIFFNAVHLLPSDMRFEHGGANLHLAPGANELRYAPGCKVAHGQKFEREKVYYFKRKVVTVFFHLNKLFNVKDYLPWNASYAKKLGGRCSEKNSTLESSRWEKCLVCQTLFSLCPQTFSFVLTIMLVLSKTVGSCVLTQTTFNS